MIIRYGRDILLITPISHEHILGAGLGMRAKSRALIWNLNLKCKWVW